MNILRNSEKIKIPTGPRLIHRGVPAIMYGIKMGACRIPPESPGKADDLE